MGLSKLSLSLLALTGGALGADLPSIVMKGQKFFYPNGTQFFMKGVAYQQDTSAGGATFTKKTKFLDPLADEDLCKRDIPLLEELGTNTIRTYAIDPEADHSFCMKMLNDAGIYVVSDLGEPQLSINRDDPKWDVEIFERYQAVVDELAQYSNVIGFFAGNEVTNNKTNTPASAYVKAAVRDTKKHIADKGYRWMGVGYAANDDTDIREEITNYFNCPVGSDQSNATTIDFWGWNVYSFCGDSSLKDSGWSDQAKFFSDYSVPVFLAEYGCREVPGGGGGRKFEETRALFSDEMTSVFSGGIVYMYFEEENDYGLVKPKSDSSVTKLDSFDYLKKEHARADPKGVDSDDYSSNLKQAQCPRLSETWKVSTNLPPTPDSDLCDCMVSAATCGPVKNLDKKDYASIFDYICGEDETLCKGIRGNATSGVYGSYHGCDDKAKLHFVLDAYYQAQDNAADACDFDGDAEVLDGSAGSGCSDALAEASSHNEEVATATTADDAPFPSDGLSGSSGDDDEDFAVPSTALMRLFSLGDYAVGLYMVVAVGVGGAMVAL